MMFCHITLFFLAVFKHREVYYPAEAEFIWINKIHTTAHFQTEFAQSLSYYLRLIGNDKDKISLFSFAEAADFTNLVFTKELGNLTLQCSIFIESDPCQALSAVMSNVFNQSVQFTTRNLSIALNVDSLNYTAIVQYVTEYLKSGIAKEVGNVVEMHIKAEIRLIRTIEIHSICPGNALERNLNIHIQYILEHSLHHMFYQIKDEVLIFK